MNPEVYREEHAPIDLGDHGLPVVSCLQFDGVSRLDLIGRGEYVREDRFGELGAAGAFLPIPREMLQEPLADGRGW